jgi:hypothetical protein
MSRYLMVKLSYKLSCEILLILFILLVPSIRSELVSSSANVRRRFSANSRETLIVELKLLDRLIVSTFVVSLSLLTLVVSTFVVGSSLTISFKMPTLLFMLFVGANNMLSKIYLRIIVIYTIYTKFIVLYYETYLINASTGADNSSCNHATKSSS